MEANAVTFFEDTGAAGNGAGFAQTLSEHIAALPLGDHEFSLPVGGASVYFRARIVKNARQLLFTFHGVFDQEARNSVPINGFFPRFSDTHQVAISDPSLALSRKLGVAWFAGHKGFDTQFHLRTALPTIAKALGIERTVYCGTSAGGFAALYYSWHDPSSIAVVSNPQTNILSYSAFRISAYREYCWPQLQTNSELAAVTCTDLTQLYAQGFSNTVIYCQSMGDVLHATKHMLPFAGAIADQPQARRFLLHSYFEGEHGHSGQLIYATFLNWVRAVTSCPTDKPEDLLDSWYALRSRNNVQGAEPPASPSTPAAFRPEDIDLAARLHAYREAHR